MNLADDAIIMVIAAKVKSIFSKAIKRYAHIAKANPANVWLIFSLENDQPVYHVKILPERDPRFIISVEELLNISFINGRMVADQESQGYLQMMPLVIRNAIITFSEKNNIEAKICVQLDKKLIMDGVTLMLYNNFKFVEFIKVKDIVAASEFLTPQPA